MFFILKADLQGHGSHHHANSEFSHQCYLNHKLADAAKIRLSRCCALLDRPDFDIMIVNIILMEGITV